MAQRFAFTGGRIPVNQDASQTNIAPPVAQRFAFTGGRIPVNQASAATPVAASSPRPTSLAPLSPTVATLATTAIANGSIGAAGSQGLAGANGPVGAGVMMPTFDFSKSPQANPFLAMTGLADPNAGRNTQLGAADYNRRLSAMQQKQSRNWGGPTNLMQAMATGGNYQLGQQGLANQRDLGFGDQQVRRDLGFGDQSTRKHIADQELAGVGLTADANKFGSRMGYLGTQNTNQANQAIAAGRDKTSLGVADIGARASMYGADKLGQYNQGMLDLKGRDVGEQLAQGQWNRDKALTPAKQQQANALLAMAQDPNQPPQVQQDYMNQYAEMMGIKRPAIPASTGQLSGLSPAMLNKAQELARSGKGGNEIRNELRLNRMSDEDIDKVLGTIFAGSMFTPNTQNPEGTLGGEIKPRGLVEHIGAAGALAFPPLALPSLAAQQGWRMWNGSK